MKIIEKDDKYYPKRLLKIKNPPKKLYVEGNAELLNNISIAIVGPRSCSEYGIKYTKEFTKALAEQNVTIISGLALGIDSIAHETSKDCTGKTIAVLGGGFNHIYPEEHQELFTSILKTNGCIVSEYAPEQEVDMKNFPKRNRIISGIASGVFVVEARNRSGSTITGKLGLEQNKPVFCLPRDIGNKIGAGTNELIKKGARLVTKPEDILEILGIINDKKTKITGYKTQKIEKINVPDEYLNIYQLISYTPQNIEYLSAKSRLKISDITQKLIMLELQGYIKSMPGNYYVRT